MAEFRKVKVGKIDLDTIATGFVMGVSRQDQVEVLRGEVSPEDLLDPSTLCIEVGLLEDGNDEKYNNFDHHYRHRRIRPHSVFCAAYQAYLITEERCRPLPEEFFRENTGAGEPWRVSLTEDQWSFRYTLVSEYVNLLDLRGPEPLRQILAIGGISYQEIFPTISDIISGILLVEKDPVEAFHRGIEFLHYVEDLWLGGWCPKWVRLSLREKRQLIRGIPDEEAHAPVLQMEKELAEKALRAGKSLRRLPLYLWGPIPAEGEWAPYVRAKVANEQQVLRTIKEAHWTSTHSGLKMAFLETEFFGAPGALYGQGAQVVVVLNPAFGPAKVKKFTIAGNNVRVDGCLPRLNTLEPGWGGPPSGTILGSPLNGSSLSLEKIVEIVRENL